MSYQDEFILPLKPVARWACVGAGGLALLVLAGWAADIPRLTRWTGSGPPMLPAVAAAFVLLASALLLRQPAGDASRFRSGLARVFSWTALVLGVLAGSEDPGLRAMAHTLVVNLLPFGRAPVEPDPGFRGGLSLILLPIALLLFGRRGRWSNRIYVASALVPVLVALLAVIGHACRLPSFYGWIGWLRPVVSLPGAMAAILLGIALFAARPDLEVTRMVAGRTFGGYVARWLLLTPVAVPLFNGLLMVSDPYYRRIGPDLAGWIFSFSNILLFTVIIGLTALLLHRLARQRRRAEETVRRLNESLEAEVLRRTDELTRTNLRLEREIRERADAEQQLLRAQRVECLGAIAGGIAHDLNNALSPIQLACKLLETENSPGESRALLDLITRSVRRSSDLVRQLLAFTRGTRAGREAIDLGRLLVDLERTLGAVFPRSIAMTVRCSGDLPPLQVLMTLAINARDAMPVGGRLDILADREAPPSGGGPSRVRVIVRDTGTGIAPEHLPHVFEPFFTTKEKGKGTGLGLPTVRRILEQHGGGIRIESTPGAGTAVTVDFPCAERPSATPEWVSAPALEGKGERILVVEDEEALGQLLQETLEQADYRVSVCLHGAAALERLAGDPGVDLVLSDWDMPGLGGRDFLHALHTRWPHLLVVSMSGSFEAEPPGGGRPSQGDHLLKKPFTRDELLTTLHRALSSRRSEAAPARGPG